MGLLRFFDLSVYNADILVETGTGIAMSLTYAMKYQLEGYYSCEINKQLFDKNMAAFTGVPHVKLYNCDSLTFLREVLPQIPKEKKIIFWLDAHFPGADYLHHEFSSEDNEVNLPLLHEVKLVYEHRKDCKDVILIDDLRMLIPYAKDILEKAGLFLNYPGLGFLDCFKDTHKIIEHRVHEGYLEVTPYA